MKKMNEISRIKSKNNAIYKTTSLPKLRNQLKNMKTEGKKIGEKSRADSGLAPQNEPE